MEDKFELKPAEEFMYDLYSARAMSAIIGTLDWKETSEEESDSVLDYSQITEAAFDMTEAMILERRKRKEK